MATTSLSKTVTPSQKAAQEGGRNRKERQEYREFFALLPPDQQDEQIRIVFHWLLTKLAQRLHSREAACITQQDDIVAGLLAGGE